MVNVKGINKHFGHLHVLKDVSLDVARGEVVVIIGPSGSGKSTLLRCLNYLEPVQSGEIRVDGIRLDHHKTNIRKVRAEVGMVFQSFNLFPHLSVLRNVMLAPVIVRKRPEAEVRREALALLAKVGLQDKTDAFPAQLSGGQQQRVAIARALVNEPKVLIGDEPTGNLDSKTEAAMFELFDELNRQGTTVIYVTHSQALAAKARHKVEIVDGQLVQA